MTDKSSMGFGLPRKGKPQPEPWWKFKPPFDVHGIDGNIAYKGLLDRAVMIEEEQMYTFMVEGCFPGTWEELQAVWPKGYHQVRRRFREKPDPSEGNDWPDDPRPLRQVVGVDRDGSFMINHRFGQDPAMATIELCTSQEATYLAVRKWCEDHLTPAGLMGVVRCLSRPKPTSPFSLITLGRFEDTYEPENYDPQVIEQFDHLIEDLNSDSPRGRMAIIHGPPGTGKTYLLKAITQACPKALVIFVPNTLVSDLGNPELIEVFTEYRSSTHQRIILLAEDADVIFRQRDKDNTNAISSALNLTDGMFGELLKVYIVGTTNVRLDQVDEAVRRPGRLSEEILVGPLGAEQALQVYRRIKEDPEAVLPDRLSKGGTLAEVYSVAGVTRKKKKARPAPGPSRQLSGKAPFGRTYTYDP